ncbi:MAG TPA: TonB family protein [Pyrinomonadaceae bacterium]|nr:TonB family protein [Pyrinomonadaceae bacterium]
MVSAQTSSCAVKLDVTQSSSEAKITGAAANAYNKQTKKIYKSVLKSGMPYFAKLPDGNYRVTVSKVGFKRSADDFRLDCSESDSEPWAIELFKGNARQIVNLYSRVLKAPPLKRSEAAFYNVGEANKESSTTDSVKTNRYQMSPDTSRTINGGVINSKATNLVKPPYPAAAKAVRASGAVNVQVTIDEQGNVISASAVSGHPLLRAAAVQAARASTFSPTLLSGQPVKVTGIIVYNFVP